MSEGIESEGARRGARVGPCVCVECVGSFCMPTPHIRRDRISIIVLLLVHYIIIKILCECKVVWYNIQ